MRSTYINYYSIMILSILQYATLDENRLWSNLFSFSCRIWRHRVWSLIVFEWGNFQVIKTRNTNSYNMQKYVCKSYIYNIVFISIRPETNNVQWNPLITFIRVSQYGNMCCTIKFIIHAGTYGTINNKCVDLRVICDSTSYMTYYARLMANVEP